jgi:hypothetical protein
MLVIRRGDAVVLRALPRQNPGVAMRTRTNAAGDRVVLVHWFDQARRVWMFDDALRLTRSRRAFRLVRALNGRRRAERKRL